MTDLIGRTLNRLGQQLRGRLSMPAMSATPPPRRSGRSRWAGCPARSSTVGRLRTCNWPFGRPATLICYCQCEAEATTGPVVPCAMESLST